MREDNARSRISLMLERDKEEMNEASKAAALNEFNRVAREYFEPTGQTVFTVKRAKGGYEVTVSFHAVRVKNFTSL